MPNTFYLGLLQLILLINKLPLRKKNSALYSLRSGLSNEVSLGIPLHLKKKVRGSCALPGGYMQKPYTPKCGQGKTKIDLFRDFLQNVPMSKL
jgi:hypothetical protein